MKSSSRSCKKCCFIITLVLAILTPTALCDSYLQSKFSQLSGFFSNLVGKRQNLSSLPTLSECGVLREDQFFNLQRTVEVNEFPWMATLIHRINRYECISVLISKQYLLAAANCFNEDLNPNSYFLQLGSCRLKGPCTVAYNLELFRQHPAYIKDKAGSDISLLRLRQTITFTDDIRPICLPSSDVTGINFVTQHLIMTGRQLMGSLHAKFFVLITSNSRCQRAFTVVEVNVDDKMICASTCDNGSNYVSGSALMGVSMKNSMPDYYYLVGLLSAGKNGCLDNSPDIFQRIDQHMEWITESIAKLDGLV